MKVLACSLVFLLAISCNSGYDPRKETEHVNNLNRDRLYGMLGSMMDRIKTYKFVYDPDIDFAALIKIHHRTAVEMAQREKEWSKKPEMVKLAKEMISTESGEIERLEGYEDTHKPERNTHAFFDEARKLLSDEQRPNETGNIDRVFARLMIIHHKSAIAISELYLKYSSDSSMKTTAEEIIHHHAQNVSELERLAKDIPDSPSKS